MRAVARTGAVALFLTLTVLMVPSETFSQGPPTLGLKVSSEVYGDSASPTLLLSSRATAPTLVSLALPQGWTLEETTLRLEPGEDASLPFQNVGPTSEMVTRQTLLDPVTGGTQGALEIATKLLSTRPVPPTDWRPVFLSLTLALVLLIAVVASLRWLRHNVSITRR